MLSIRSVPAELRHWESRQPVFMKASCSAAWKHGAYASFELVLWRLDEAMLLLQIIGASDDKCKRCDVMVAKLQTVLSRSLRRKSHMVKHVERSFLTNVVNQIASAEDRGDSRIVFTLTRELCGSVPKAL